MSFDDDYSELAEELRRALPLDASPLSPKAISRAFNALRRAGLASKKDVTDAYPERPLRLGGFGLSSLTVVKKAFFPGSRFIAKEKNVSMANPLIRPRPLMLWPGCMAAPLMQTQSHPTVTMVARDKKIKPETST